jgi:hypothetical protein
VGVCKANGMTEQQVADVVKCWEEHRIPLNEKTAPLFSEHNLSGKLGKPGKDATQSSAATNHRGVFIRDGQKKRYWVKCYASAEVIAGGRAITYMKPAGISTRNPRFESRHLLVARLAEQLGWSGVTPKAAMGYINARPCLVTEFVDGRNWLDDVLRGDGDSMAYRNYFEKNYRNGQAVPVLTGSARRDFEMLSVLGLLVGDIDMNVSHLVAQGSPITSLQCTDWDMSFGKNLRSHADVQKRHDPLVPHDGNHPRWPSAEALRELAGPFLERLSPDVLRDLAQGLITPEETDALVARFESMRAYLQAHAAGA